MAAAKKYPFVPRSNRQLSVGDFWSIPLADGRFACGRVLEIQPDDTWAIWAGLLDWVGTDPPTFDAIAGRKTVEEGQMHVISIKSVAGRVLGHRPLELDKLKPRRMKSQMERRGCMLVQGFKTLGRITDSQFRRLPTQSTWSREGILHKAQRRFAKDAA